MPEPLETIIICENDQNSNLHIGEDGKGSPFQVIFQSQYPNNIPETVKFNAHAEVNIIHGVVHSLELCETKKVKMDFRLNEQYQNLKLQLELMVKNYNNHPKIIFL